MSEFNFKSQVCTDKIQSERLLALGLKKETADCCYQIAYLDCGLLKKCSPSLIPHNIIDGDRFIPAWSLGRLVEIIKGCDFKVFESEIWRRETKHFILRLLVTTPDDLFENAIQVIETLVCKGYFNKEYLV